MTRTQAVTGLHRMTPYELNELTNYASDLRKRWGVTSYGYELTK